MKLRQFGLNVLSMHSMPGTVVSSVQTTRTHYFSLKGLHVHQKPALMLPNVVFAIGDVPNQSHREGAVAEGQNQGGLPGRRLGVEF